MNVSWAADQHNKMIYEVLCGTKDNAKYTALPKKNIYK